jgi:hypothetical protein
MNINYIIGLIHITCVTYTLFYPIFFNNYFYNIIYILYFYILVLLYFLLKGECIITLIYNLINNKNYKIGSDVFNFPDIKLVCPFIDNKFVIFIFTLIPIYYIYMLYKFVNNTKAIPKYYFYIFVICFLFYMLYLRKFFNESLFNKYKVENYMQFFYILSIPFLLYSIYLLIKKLYNSKNKKIIN